MIQDTAATWIRTPGAKADAKGALESFSQEARGDREALAFGAASSRREGELPGASQALAGLVLGALAVLAWGAVCLPYSAGIAGALFGKQVGFFTFPKFWLETFAVMMLPGLYLSGRWTWGAVVSGTNEVGAVGRVVAALAVAGAAFLCLVS